MSKHNELKKEEDIKNLIKNFNLLRIVEKIELRKSIMCSQTILSGDKSLLNESDASQNNMIKNAKSNEVDFSKIENGVVPDQLCKRHMLPVHSYAIGTSLYVCDKCILETNLKTYPLPNVLTEIKYLGYKRIEKKDRFKSN
jgi:hypothetical protein